MSRPSLSPSMSAAELRNWYYLKAELIDFAKSLKIKTAGLGKDEIIDKLVARLDGRDENSESTEKVPEKASKVLTLHDLIPKVGQCGTASRNVFVSRFGTRFKFDGHLRDFLKENAGKKTMKEACDFYENSRDLPRKEIASQFQYNRFMRDFKQIAAKYPGKTAKEAWMEYRNTPADKRK